MQDYNFSPTKFVKLSIPILIILALILFIGGSTTGYFISPLGSDYNICQDNLAAVNKSNIELESSLTDCQNSGKDLNEKLGTCSSDLSKCNEEVTSLTGNNTALSQTVQEFTLQNNYLNNTLSSLNTNFSAIAKNYANKICCQLRVLGFNYDSYKVSDNDVLCQLNGDIPLNCTI